MIRPEVFSNYSFLKAFSLCLYLFLIQYFFEVASGWQQNWAEGTEISYITPPHAHTQLPPLSASPSEWPICYHEWTFADTALSLRVHSLCQSSLLVLCIPWVWTDAWQYIHHDMLSWHHGIWHMASCRAVPALKSSVLHLLSPHTPTLTTSTVAIFLLCPECHIVRMTQINFLLIYQRCFVSAK